MLASQWRLSSWIVAYVRAHEGELAEVVGPRRIPPSMDAPLGCGVFGCVYPTREPGIVMKGTFDQSEGEFVAKAVAWAQEDGGFPAGIVRYDALIDAPAEVPPESAGRFLRAIDGTVRAYDQLRLYLLWREEAFFEPEMADKVDQVFSELTPYDERMTFLHEAIVTGEPPAVVSELRARLELLLELEAPSRQSKPVWEALRYYTERGLLITDLHDENLGLVYRDFVPVCVITDPGRVLTLPPLG